VFFSSLLVSFKISFGGIETHNVEQGLIVCTIGDSHGDYFQTQPLSKLSFERTVE